MSKPELGTKRLCAGCAVKFYDLMKDPIVCPKCEAVFIVPKVLPPRTKRVYDARPMAVKPVEAEEPVAAVAKAEGDEPEVEGEEKEGDDKEADGGVALLEDDEEER